VALLEEIRKISLTIRQLEIDLGEPPSDDRPVPSGDGFRVSSDELPESIPAPAGRPVEVRRDEFFGMTQSDAAKVYLGKVGHAVSMDELVAKLQAGGCKVGGANAKHTLYVSLVRNTREFVPVGDGFIGLRRFYPNLKTVAAKTAVKAKGKKHGKRKAKKLLAKKKPQTPKAAPEETLAHKTVYVTLRDGELHSKEAILKAGKDAGVMPIAIHGILNNAKDLEMVGDSYRLKAGTRKVEDVKVG
jgi:hypothetical protein